MTATAPQSFLVMQPAFLGDVVLATAIVEKLRQYYPTARIDFLLRKGNEPLLKDHPYIHTIWVRDKKRNKLAETIRLLRAIRKAHYDVVINLHRFGLSGFLAAFSRARAVRGFDKNPFSILFTKRFPHRIGEDKHGHYFHETERNQRLIADLTDARAALPRLYPSVEDFEAVKTYQRQPYVCIAPASVWFTKQWPAQKWAELLAKWPDQQTFIIGAPGDSALADDIIRLAGGPSNVANLCGRLSLLQSAALLAGAVMNYTNDSGPLHLCSAMQAPVTAVFLSTVPEFGFGPIGPHGKVAQVEGLYCKPCGLHGHRTCPEGHFRCAWDLQLGD